MEGSIMGQIRHGGATTTHAVRATIQRAQASIAELSRELGINPKTVANWRQRLEFRPERPLEPTHAGCLDHAEISKPATETNIVKGWTGRTARSRNARHARRGVKRPDCRPSDSAAPFRARRRGPRGCTARRPQGSDSRSRCSPPACRATAPAARCGCQDHRERSG